MLELFYSDADPASQEAIAFVAKHTFGERVRLRNEKDPGVQADFTAKGGKRWPAIFDGEHLVDGTAAVMATLSGLMDDDRHVENSPAMMALLSGFDDEEVA